MSLLMCFVFVFWAISNLLLQLLNYIVPCVKNTQQKYPTSWECLTEKNFGNTVQTKLGTSLGKCSSTKKANIFAQRKSQKVGYWSTNIYIYIYIIFLYSDDEDELNPGLCRLGCRRSYKRSCSAVARSRLCRFWWAQLCQHCSRSWSPIDHKRASLYSLSPRR